MIWATILLGMVTYLVDGDTLDIVDKYGNKERIRIHGVDAPEMNTQAGKEAKDFMRRWLLGKQLTCSQKKGISYGRIVRMCCHGDIDVAAVLTNLGHAVSVPKYDKAGRYARPNGEHASSHCEVR